MGASEKWNKIFSQSGTKTTTASEVLQQNLHLLPDSGEALDLACGLGGNALLLAERGFETHAWDISSVAIDKLNNTTREKQLSIYTEVRDVEQNPPRANSFDVIVAGNFLHRPSFVRLVDALRNNGLLFYQTFTEEKVDDIGPSNPDFLLIRNELLRLCKSMDVLVYREEGKQGDIKQGWRNQAMIVARKLAI